MSMIDQYCHHCGDFIKRYDSDRIGWCGKCISSDYELLFSSVDENVALPRKNAEYFFWSFAHSIGMISKIPKKLKIEEAPPTQPAPQISQSQNSFCKKKYYGIECECTRCQNIASKR